MGRRKPSYRRANQNWLSMFLITMVVAVILIVVGVKGNELQAKIESDEAKIAILQEQIEKQHLRTKEIEEFRKYTQTKKYIEEVAKEKLGLVYPGELIFKRVD
ncbi:MAG: septum formation initiator family protein [Lachnospiraceae bacterium]|nr:septum formation initiator family protein [Lachnospiraceae bacterium]